MQVDHKYTTCKPPHPGEILEEHYIKPLNLNYKMVAKHLKISPQTLYKVRKKQASLTPKIAIRLSLAFNTTIEYWLYLQRKYDLWIVINKTFMPHITQIYPSKEHKNLKKYLKRDAVKQEIKEYGHPHLILSRLRQENDLTHKEFSNRLNISVQELYEFEKGIQRIDKRTISKIIEIFKVEPRLFSDYS